MQKTNFELRGKAMRFNHFSNKGYALFACMGRVVLIGTLSVATLQHAKAEGVSARPEAAADTLKRTELKLDEVVVTGSRAPLTQNEAAKIVSVITRDDIHRASAETVNDVLKMAIGVDVRQRGAFGVQTDISIDGGTFDQIAILLNGVNISNPQTGHLSADFPVSLDDIERIEIIEGAASRVYGASAFNGAINIVTGKDAKSNGNVAAEGGSYGSFGLSARGALESRGLHNSLSVGYKQSDGGTSNSYFRKSQAFYQGAYSNKTMDLDWQFGINTMRYGANTFYSAAYPNQYESNMRMFAMVRDNIRCGSAITVTPTVYWNRSFDHFQLTRGSAAGENFHRTDVVGGSLNANADWVLGRTSLGAEIRKEMIYSTNLGVPLEKSEYVAVSRHDGVFYNKYKQRTDLNIFLEHNVLLRHFTASVGVVANRNTGYNDSFRLYPGVDLSYRPDSHWKLTASWNMAFRMPTFTDLFYKSPTQEGNQGLKPEKTQSLRIAARYRTKGVEAQVSGFYDWGTDMIDWVMYNATDIYHSANFKLDNRGYQVSVAMNLADLAGAAEESFLGKTDATLKLAYAFIDQKRRDDVEIFKSNYAMEYLRHKFTAQLNHRIVSSLSASWAFRLQKRMGSYIIYENNKSTGVPHAYNPYGLLDLKLQWTARKYELSVTMNNLTAHRYFDLGNVEQPGFWLMAGAKWKF